MKAPLIAAVAGVGIGFGAGWLASHSGGNQPAVPVPTNSLAPTPAAIAVVPDKTRRPEGEVVPLRGLPLETALRSALAEPNEELRREKLRQLAAQTDLDAYGEAIAKASRILPLLDRQSYQVRLLELLVARDPQAAVAAAKALPDRNLRQLALGAVIQAWARQDANALLRWHLAQPEAEQRDQLSHLGSALGLYAPATGQQYLRGLKGSVDRRGFIREFFNSWSQRDASAAFQAGNQLLLADGFDSDLGGILARWAQSDFAAARNAVLQLGAPTQHWNVFLSFFSTVAGDQPAAAAELVGQVPNGTRRHELINALLVEWVPHDVKAAQRWVEGLTDPNLKRLALGSLANALSDSDPKAALALLSGVNLGGEGVTLYRNIAARLTERDPKAALGLYESLTNPSLRREVLLGVMDSWSASDPKAASTYAAQLPPGPVREAALNSLINGWSGHDLKAAVEFTRGLTSRREQVELLQPLIWRIGSENPELGKELFASMPPGSNRAALLGNFASSWAQEDLASARIWIESLPEGPLRREALSALPAMWARQDPEAAAAYALTVTDPQLQRLFAQSTVQEWVQSNPDAALTWAKGLPVGAMRDSAIQSLADFHAGDDPRLATELALQLKSPDAQRSSLLSIVSNWSGNDPKAAADWVSQFPAGELREEAATEVVNAWAAHDPGASGEWLKQLPAGLGRDNAAEAYITHVRDEDPAAAGAWAESLGDPERRYAAIQDHLGWWWEQDAKAAEKWLDSLTASPEQKAQWKNGALERVGELKTEPATP